MSLQKYYRRAVSYVVGLTLCVLISSCGSNSTKRPGDRKFVQNIASSDNGKVVNSARVPSALKRTGLRLVFQAGPKPADFQNVIYGIASNSHGSKINFGFFFVANTTASLHERPELSRFVPRATSIGSTAGESYIEITSAGWKGKPGSRKTSEELGIAGELHWAVAGLARKALEEEGP